jgi:hypothetical protein
VEVVPFLQWDISWQAVAREAGDQGKESKLGVALPCLYKVGCGTVREGHAFKRTQSGTIPAVSHSKACGIISLSMYFLTSSRSLR